MLRSLSSASHRTFDPLRLRIVSLTHNAVSRSISNALSEQQTKYTLLLNSSSKRRVENSPTLPLEAVSLPTPVRERVRHCLAEQSLSARHVRAHATPINLIRAPESLAQKKSKRRLGRPVVEPPPLYDANQTLAFAAIRMPGTFAANVFVMAEAARLCPEFQPNSMLDFGSGPASSLISASRIFSQGESARAGEEREHLHSIQRATLLDKSAHMQSLAKDIIENDPWINFTTSISHVSSLRECPSREMFDLVTSSYSLNEIVRDAIASPSRDSSFTNERDSITRDDRVKHAEKKLRRVVKALWSRTAPNGLLIVIEDGTAAGFEAITFVRDTILKTSSPFSDAEDEGNIAPTGSEDSSNNDLQPSAASITTANVIAPCLHSRSCPLDGSITRHRICRFQQRLNRPLYSRTALPMKTGYEDEYFSYLVVQKLVENEKVEMTNQEAKDRRWGRLIRQPLQKGKHVALDACTREGTLERRVVSKKNSTDGTYPRARRAKWGDIWPSEPSTAPQAVNF